MSKPPKHKHNEQNGAPIAIDLLLPSGDENELAVDSVQVGKKGKKKSKSLLLLQAEQEIKEIEKKFQNRPKEISKEQIEREQIKRRKEWQAARNKKIDVRSNIDKMIALLTQANYAQLSNLPMFYEDETKSRRLEFTHQTKCEYLKHQKLATQVMLNPNTRCFTSFNDKELVVWKPAEHNSETLFKFPYTELDKLLSDTKESVEDDQFKNQRNQPENIWDRLTEKKSESTGLAKITCICYSPKFYLYFAFTTTQHLIVFNEYLNIVSLIKLEIRTVQKCYLVEETKQIITAGVQGCHLIQLKITFKYEARRATKLDTYGESITVEIDSNKKIIQRKNQEFNDSFSGYLEFKGVQNYSMKDLSLNGLEEKDVRGMSLDIDQQFFACWGKKTCFLYFFKPERIDFSFSEMDTKSTDLSEETRWQLYRSKIETQREELKKQLYPIAKFNDLTANKDDLITGILFVDHLHYLVVSTNMGKIGIYKWDRREKKEYMDSFNSHTKGITSLKMFNLKNTSVEKQLVKQGLNKAAVGKGSYIVSASFDGFIKIWCLEKLKEIYSFEVWSSADGTTADSMDRVELIDDKIYSVFLKGQTNAIEIGMISHLTTCFFISKPIIQQVEKGFVSLSSQRHGNPENIIVSFDNNSILVLDSQKGETLSTLYPPPTPTTISTILYQMSLQRLILLLQNGSIAMYKIYRRDTATLEFMQEAKHLKDADEKSLSGSSITCIMLTSVVPPHFDCELFSEQPRNPKRRARIDQCSRSRHTSRDGSPQSEDLAYDQSDPNYSNEANDNFLVLGLSKGHVCFVRLDMTNYIYARFLIHRQHVTHLQQIKSKEQTVFISMCQEQQLQLWGFEEGKKREVKYRTFQMQRPLNRLLVFNQNVLLIWGSEGEQKNNSFSGDTTYLQFRRNFKGPNWDGVKENDRGPALYVLPCKKDNEHDNPIIASDFSESMQIHCTVDNSGLIKIWNEKRDLIREIKFDQENGDIVSSVVFYGMNEWTIPAYECDKNGEKPLYRVKVQDLLVGHGGKLSKIRVEDYLVKSDLIPENIPEECGCVRIQEEKLDIEAEKEKTEEQLELEKKKEGEIKKKELLKQHGQLESNSDSVDSFLSQEKSDTDDDRIPPAVFYEKGIQLTDSHLDDWKNGRNQDLFEKYFADKQSKPCCKVCIEGPYPKQGKEKLLDMFAQRSKMNQKVVQVQSKKSEKNSDFNLDTFNAALQKAVTIQQQEEKLEQIKATSTILQSKAVTDTHKSFYDDHNKKHKPRYEDSKKADDFAFYKTPNIPSPHRQTTALSLTSHPLSQKPAAKPPQIQKPNVPRHKQHLLTKAELAEINYVPQPKNRQQLTAERIAHSVKHYQVQNPNEIKDQFFVTNSNQYQYYTHNPNKDLSIEVPKKRVQTQNSCNQTLVEPNLIHQETLKDNQGGLNPPLIISDPAVRQSIGTPNQTDGLRNQSQPSIEVSQPPLAQTQEIKRQNVIIQSTSNVEISPRSQTNAALSQYMDQEQMNLETKMIGITASVKQKQADKTPIQNQEESLEQLDQPGFDFQTKPKRVASAHPGTTQRLMSAAGRFKQNKFSNNQLIQTGQSKQFIKTDTLETALFVPPQTQHVPYNFKNRVQTAKINTYEKVLCRNKASLRQLNRKVRMQSHRIGQQNFAQYWCGSGVQNSPSQQQFKLTQQNNLPLKEDYEIIESQKASTSASAALARTRPRSLIQYRKAMQDNNSRVQHQVESNKLLSGGGLSQSQNIIFNQLGQSGNQTSKGIKAIISHGSTINQSNMATQRN